MEMLWAGRYSLPDSAQGCTFLTHAASQGHIGIVDCLVTWKPSDVDVMDSRGINALYAASMENRADVVSLLLRAGADPCSVSTEAEWTPLMVAAYMGHKAVLDLFLCRELPPEEFHRAIRSPKTGETALMCAAMAGKTACIAACMAACMQQKWCPQDIWKETREGLSALDVAVKHGHEEVVKLLLRVVTALSFRKQEEILTTSFSLAVEHNQIAIGKLLLYAGARPVFSGLSPLYIAILGGNADMATLCTQHRPTVMSSPYNASLAKYAMVLRGVPVVHWRLKATKIADPYKLLGMAVERLDSASVKFLLAHSPIDRLMCDGDDNEESLLCRAAGIGYCNIVTMLLEFGLDPNRGSGLTPLYIAASKGLFRMVDRLVAYGADVDSQRHPLKHTPFFVACRNKHWTVAFYLLKAGANPMLPLSDPTYAHAYDVLVKSTRCGASQECLSYIHAIFQEQEDRVALLLKARLFVDTQHTCHTSFTMGTGRTRGQKRQKFTARLPDCIRHRVEKSARLPSIKIHADDDHHVSQIAELVIRGTFNDHLFQELISLFPC